MSASAQNIASEYYRSVSMSYAQAANFQKTQSAIKQAKEAAEPSKPSKVVLAQVVKESQKTPPGTLKVAADIRRFAAQGQVTESVEAESRKIDFPDASAEKVAQVMARNAKRQKPVFQSERKPFALLA